MSLSLMIVLAPAWFYRSYVCATELAGSNAAGSALDQVLHHRVQARGRSYALRCMSSRDMDRARTTEKSTRFSSSTLLRNQLTLFHRCLFCVYCSRRASPPIQASVLLVLLFNICFYCSSVFSFCSCSLLHIPLCYASPFIPFPFLLPELVSLSPSPFFPPFVCPEFLLSLVFLYLPS